MLDSGDVVGFCQGLVEVQACRDLTYVCFASCHFDCFLNPLICKLELPIIWWGHLSQRKPSLTFLQVTYHFTEQPAAVVGFNIAEELGPTGVIIKAIMENHVKNQLHVGITIVDFIEFQFFCCRLS